MLYFQLKNIYSGHIMANRLEQRKLIIQLEVLCLERRGSGYSWDGGGGIMKKVGEC